MKKLFNISAIVSLIIGLSLFSCDPKVEDDISLPEKPVVNFTFEANPENSNEIVFTSTSSGGFLYNWDFGNGASSTKTSDKAYYPFKGDFEVTLTVSGKGGSATLKQTVNMAQSDPAICNDEVMQKLTGGCDATNGKTWVMDRDVYAHFGIGPLDSNFPDWYAAQPNEKASEGCLYNDELTFFLKNSVFELDNKGATYFNADQIAAELGVESPGADACYDYQIPETNFSITEVDGKTMLSISNNGFLTYFDGAHEYEIIELTDDVLYVRSNVGFGYWYYRFIPFSGVVAAPEASFTQSADTSNPLQITFNNTSTDATSYSWDFGDGNTSTESNPVHTYDAAGDYTVSLTAVGEGGTSSTSATITVTGDINLYDFLTGGGSKTWKLSPTEGAMLVGPGDGSAWWQNSEDDITTRACQFNDTYTFTTGNEYNYAANGDGWKAWELFKDFEGCIDETEDWFNKFDESLDAYKSGNHAFSLDGEVITVAGNGAFIAIPDSGTPNITHTPQSESTYTILEVVPGDTQDMIKIRGTGGGSDGTSGDPRPGFWDITLISEK